MNATIDITTTIRHLLLAAALAVGVVGCTSSTPDAAGAPSSSHRTAPSGEAPDATSAPEVAKGSGRPTEAVDRLVDTAHGKLHLRCAGDGPVTVLLLAGWEKGAEAWGPFHGSVAEHARACAYDRFGTGSSDAPVGNQTFASQVGDLHDALETAGEPGPYLVVGHSFGGAEAVVFASTYEDEASGVVLVDASPDDWPSVVCSVPAYQSACSSMRDPQGGGERLDVFPAFEEVSRVATLGDLPLTVITAAHRSPDGITPDERARLDRQWAAGEQRWADRSSASRLVTVDETGHDIHLDQPQAVLAEVLGLLP